MRLFVATLLEPPLLEAIGRIQASLRRLDSNGAVRWADPKGIHLTLKFLGEVGEEAVPGIEASLAESLEGLQAPRLGIAGLGSFPNRRRPRVLWVGIREEAGGVARLQSRVEDACASQGWEREGRRFQPHLTVGRMRESGPGLNPQGELSIALEADTRGDETPLLPHPRVALMRSHLSPRGARYEELRVWQLPVEDPSFSDS